MSSTSLEELRGFQAVLFDLDGTIVKLKTDWREAHRRVDPLLKPHTDTDLSRMSIWKKVDLGRLLGIGAVEKTIAALEVDGARQAEAYPLAHLLRSTDLSLLGICTMNCRRSVELSLDRFQLFSSMAVVVAREDCPAQKPDPLPLLQCLRVLDLEAPGVVYVGDMRRDEEAAGAAGMAFVPAQRFNGGKYPFEPPS